MNEKDALTLERLPTGVGGLDDILHGGLFEGGMYIVKGAPGAGKTILANQICFNHVARGGCALFVTLLAETHSRMFQHLHTLDFFDQDAIPHSLYYISAFDVLESAGLKGVIELLRQEIRAHHAGVVVLDGFANTEASAGSEREFKKFVHELQNHAAAAGCTMLILTNGGDRAFSPEYTMVDGVFEIQDTLYEQRTERTLQVLKFRGSNFLGGRHALRISASGLVLFPRIEAMFNVPSQTDTYQALRTTSGVSGIDDILKGGLLAATTSGVYGPTGVGKTTLALHFLSRSSAEERGLLVSFFERPERLRVRAEGLGIDLRSMEARGEVELLWCPQGEHILDEVGHLIINSVRTRGIKRLFIDGFGGLLESAVSPNRMTRYISALSNELRALNVTVLMSIESHEILGSNMELPTQGMSSLLEGLIVMRYVELDGQIRRLVSITKMRDSDFDPFLHEFTITSQGIEVGRTFSGVEAMLSGHGRVPKLGSASDERATPPKD